MSAALDTHRVLDRPRSRDVVLALSCPDVPGIVLRVATFLVEHDANIVESQQFEDRRTGRFHLRVEVEPVGAVSFDVDALRSAFAPLAASLSMSWRLHAVARRQRVLVMVSRAGHCLNDLLFRAANGSLDIDVPAVVSNHGDLAQLAANYGVPFHHIPVVAGDKGDAEAKLLALVGELDVDLVVLARYMQILSPALCEELAGRAINIHHSMLPSFKGARPYFQAHDRGVKVIGATAHYVTPDLDEGPIIEQQVARVDHTMTPEDITEVGRDVECLALARAVRWHSENRVLLDGRRTVVLA